MTIMSNRRYALDQKRKESILKKEVKKIKKVKLKKLYLIRIEIF